MIIIIALKNTFPESHFVDFFFLSKGTPVSLIICYAWAMSQSLSHLIIITTMKKDTATAVLQIRRLGSQMLSDQPRVIPRQVEQRLKSNSLSTIGVKF